MPEFKSLTELNKYLQKQIKDALNNEVSEVVKSEEQKKVKTEVYDKYNVVKGEQKEPYVYQRRGSSGGLSDKKNMKNRVKNIKDGAELSVENRTKGQDENIYIADLVEGGDGSFGLDYDYKSNRDGTQGQYLQARPFQQRTVEALEQSGEHVEAMKKGLIRNGLDVT
jgi:hypothetical protein